MTDPAATKTPAWGWFSVVIFCCAAGWITWLRLPAFSTPVWNVDEGITATIADEILAGGVPFRDATDLRAPLTYYLYAAVFAVAGVNNMAAIHVAHTVLVLATALLVLWLGRRFGGIAAAGWSVWIYSCLSCCLFNPMDNMALHTEWPLAFCSALGAWLYLEGLRRQRSGWMAGAGVFYGLAVLSKQPALLDFGAPLALQAWLIWNSPAEARRHWRSSFWLILGFALPIVLTILYFAAHGALRDFVFYTWTYNTRYYIPEVPFPLRFPTIRVPLELLHRFAPSLLVLLAASVLVSLQRVCFDRNQRAKENLADRLFASLWLMGSLFATTLSGRGFEHYSIQMLAPASLVAGQLLGPITSWTLVRLRRRNWTMAPALLVGVALALTMVVQARHCLDYRKHIVPHLDPSLPVAKFVGEMTTRQDRIFVWGFYSDIHTVANRLPASRFVHSAFLTGLIPWTNLGRDTSYAIVPGSMEALLGDLKKNRPRLIVDSSGNRSRQFRDYPPERFPALWDYIRHNYAELDPGRFAQDGFRVFQRMESTGLSVTPPAQADSSLAGDLMAPLQAWADWTPVRVQGNDPAGRLNSLTVLIDNRTIGSLHFAPTNKRLGVFFLPLKELAGPHELTLELGSSNGHQNALRQSIEVKSAADTSGVPAYLHFDGPAGTLAAIGVVSTNLKPSVTTVEGQTLWLCHAPMELIFPVPADGGVMRVGFGLDAGAYTPPHDTDGVEFVIELVAPNGTRTALWRRWLDPLHEPKDRGTQHAEIPLPARIEPGSTLRFSTLTGPAGNGAFDWAFWWPPVLFRP